MSGADFLLELRSEEIPARMQAGARADLERLFRKAMDEAGVAIGDVTVWSTPRRLALIARGLPAATAAVSEEVKGPRTSAPPQALEGFLRKTGLTQDQLTERDGVWFAVTDKPGRSTAEVLAEAIPAIVRAFPWPKSMRWGAPSLSSESLRWVRPLSGIVAILGDELVECEVGGVVSGYATRGHRFHAPGEVTIGGAHDYADKLRACHVIVDQAEREAMIREGAAAAAAREGLDLLADEGLVIENAGLTEWPVPLLGRFDAAFLEVPPEVIQLTARTNQKYFVCEAQGKLANAFVCTANIAASDGGAGVVAGNRKVLAARLSDARFFWEQDRRKTLAEHAEGLKRITFHEKLGTVADKVERVARLARWLVESGVVPAQAGTAGLVDATVHPAASGPGAGPGTTDLADLAEQAARLCKADLVTEMVGEFPELQGLMGGYYARAEGLPDAVAAAIRDHYKPVGQGDAVPTAPVTVAVSLADKLDTLFGFFAAYQLPTGSKDPFALRRSALGVVSILVKNCLRLALSAALERFYRSHAVRPPHGGMSPDAYYFRDIDDVLTEKHFGSKGFWLEQVDDEKNLEQSEEFIGQPLLFDDDGLWKDYRLGFTDELVEFGKLGAENLAWFTLLDFNWTRSQLLAFFADRLKVQQREAGVRHDLIDAVFEANKSGGSGEDDLVRLLARVHALQAFVGTEDGANLLAGYKRAANILKKEGVEAGAEVSLSYTPEPAEKALVDALDVAGPAAASAVAAEDFAGAMAALAALRAPIDAFFDSVTVNDADGDKRRARLGLLARFRDAVHMVADFSRIEG